MEKQPWKKGWKHVRNLGEGGQGRTSIVTSIDGGPEYVLKVLSRQDDEERRRRMALEVAALKILTDPPHLGIATFRESNAMNHKDPVELYLIAEFIQGPHLQKYSDGQPVTIDIAVTTLTKLLDTLEFCHKGGVIHRDIKPDNIIMRGGDADPVLIDFGLSFNETARTESFESDPQQIIANRFLSLPELLVGSQDRHSFLSDITQAAGVLFFLCTGQPPVTLRDGSDRPPHHRDHSRQILQKLPQPQLRKLDRIFDIAFRPDPQDRWQSLSQLREAVLNLVTLGGSEAFDFQVELQTLASTLEQSDAMKTHHAGMDLCRKLQNLMQPLLNQINETFKNNLSVSANSAEIKAHPQPTFQQRLFVSSGRFPTEQPIRFLEASLSGKDFKIYARLGDQSGRASDQVIEYEQFNLADANQQELMMRAAQRFAFDFIRPLAERLSAADA